MEISNIIRDGVRGKEERSICLRGANDGEELRLKVKKIDGEDHLIIVDAFGPLYKKHFGYKSRQETCFRIPLHLVQKYLRFDPVDLSGASRKECEKYFRLMSILLEVTDGEKEEAEEQRRAAQKASKSPEAPASSSGAEAPDEVAAA